VADRICRALTAEIPGVEEAYCYLVSRIGSPIDEPQIADIRLRVANPAAIQALEPATEELVRAHLHGVTELWRDVIAGRTAVC
jgi:S-adenosylmethionine synthetase